MTARMAGNVVEQNGFVADPALIDVDDTADFFFEFGTCDVLEFIVLAQQRDPRAQILTILGGVSLDGTGSDRCIHDGTVTQPGRERNYMSRTSRAVAQPQQQIMTFSLLACSSSLSTESWWIGVPEITRVSQAPQMPSSHE